MSLEPEDVVEPQPESRDVQALVKAFALFQDADAALLEAIAEQIEWFALPGGTQLFDAGDPPDALYFVLSGTLGAYVPLPGGQRRLVGRISAGETVGEMALISGNVRNATVVSLRDCELGRLSREAFETLLLGHPRGLLSITRLMVQRLDSSQRQGRLPGSIPKTIAIVPPSRAADSDPRELQRDARDAVAFADQLLTYLARIGRAEVVWNQRGAEHTTQWFHRVERNNDFVVYVCDAAATNWSKLCLRQADELLLLAHADQAPAPWPVLETNSDSSLLLQRARIVLLHRDTLTRGAARRWLAATNATGLMHVRLRVAEDFARLARTLTGRSIGVVLSGGGARGFAHLGVLRALREAGVSIDAVGGTSIGAIIAAGAASEWGIDELTARMRRCFVDTNPLNDYRLPLISLVAGNKVKKLLRGEFADAVIEDLPVPYFCVSSNLSTGQLVVHRRGDVCQWLSASVSIPGILPPCVHRGEFYVDGATLNNFPVDVMRDFGAGRVIGVDVSADAVFRTDAMDEGESPPLWKLALLVSGKRRRVNILQVLWRAGMINSSSSTMLRRDLADLLLLPPLEQIEMLNWRKFDRAIELGYRYAMQRLQEEPDVASWSAGSHAGSAIAGGERAAPLRQAQSERNLYDVSPEGPSAG